MLVVGNFLVIELLLLKLIEGFGHEFCKCITVLLEKIIIIMIIMMMEKSIKSIFYH